FFFSFLLLRPPVSTLFPYTTLFRSSPCCRVRCPQRSGSWLGDTKSAEDSGRYSPEFSRASLLALFPFLPSSPHHWMKIGRVIRADRKSTRLNSSHDQISYAVFCLKK